MPETKKTKPKSLVTQLFGSNNLIYILSGGLVLAAFFLGYFYGQLTVLKTGGVAQAKGNAVLGSDNAQAPSQPQQPTTGVASIDDDPVMGDKNSPVTIVEFSDYECPFCKRHFDETFPQLVKEYIDTGKAKLVYRDLPLPFHDPMATKEAIAANCARKQGGDSKYFEYHDEIFTRTSSNGNGLSESDLTTIATDIGLNLNNFNSCLQDPAQEDEVKKDLADASKAGATGTPSFVIGKSTSNGEIDGDLVVGAQPFAAFQAVIDPLLE